MRRSRPARLRRRVCWGWREVDETHEAIGRKAQLVDQVPDARAGHEIKAGHGRHQVHALRVSGEGADLAAPELEQHPRLRRSLGRNCVQDSPSERRRYASGALLALLRLRAILSDLACAKLSRRAAAKLLAGQGPDGPAHPLNALMRPVEEQAPLGVASDQTAPRRQPLRIKLDRRTVKRRESLL